MSYAIAESKRLSETTLDVLFREARTYQSWQARPVEPELLRELYDLVKMGPTSANSSPARFVFLTTEESKSRLIPHMNEPNRAKTLAAPVVALVGYDLAFHEKLDTLMPYRDIKSWFIGNPQYAGYTARQSGTLQGAYLILAARALGLDCGPMNGFDAEGINREFFAASSVEINFVVALGYGDTTQLKPRLPRLDFDDAVTML